MKVQQFNIPISVAYLTYQIAVRSTNAYITITFHASRFIRLKSNFGRKRLYRKNQGSNFLAGSFSNTDQIRVPIKLRER